MKKVPFRGAKVRGAASALVWLLAAALDAGGCAEILGVNDNVEDAVAQICKCGELEDFWPNGTTCDDWIRGALAADPAAQKPWLDAFDTQDCDICRNATKCSALPPVCIPIGDGPCVKDESCCAAEGVRTYCGTFENGERRCAVDQAMCTPSGSPCGSAAECCGYGGSALPDGSAECWPPVDVPTPHNDLCLEECDPDTGEPCPGCCALFKDTDEPADKARPVCIADLPFAPSANSGPRCEIACTGGCNSVGEVCNFGNRLLLIPSPYFVNIAYCQLAFPQ